MTRQEIYRGFLDTFATGKYPFEASIENDKLVLYWLWQDILSYGVIRHTEAFKCEVELFDDGTYKRHDMILTGTAGLPTGGAKGRHIDKAQKSLCLGKNLLTGESGFFTLSFNSKLMHEPLKQYLESCGLTARKIKVIE